MTSEARYCPSCGGDLSGDSAPRFCKYCGKPLSPQGARDNEGLNSTPNHEATFSGSTTVDNNSKDSDRMRCRICNSSSPKFYFAVPGICMDCFHKMPYEEKRKLRPDLASQHLSSTVRSSQDNESNDIVFDIVSLISGVLGFFVLAILFGPLAIIFGAIGYHKSQSGMAILGIILGILCTLYAFVQVSSLSWLL